MFGWVRSSFGRWGGELIRAIVPDRCPGCGRKDAKHNWGCPVLVRLSAQLLFTEDKDWRQRCRNLSADCDDMHGDEARHWRAVSEADDPPAALLEEGAVTPHLVPCDGGLMEVEEAEYNYPSGMEVLAMFRVSGMGSEIVTSSEALPFLFITRAERDNL